MINKILKTSIALAVSSQIVNAAYNPFKPDAIKLTNTAVANLNQVAVTEFNNLNTTPVINTDGDADVFTSITTNGVVCAPGTYKIDIVVYHTGSISRGNIGLAVTVDGVATGAVGTSGYIRNGSGHTESSTTLSDSVDLTSSGKIGFQYQRIANAGTITAPVGQSSMRIVRMKD